MMLPSKELVCEVLNDNSISITLLKDNMLFYQSTDRFDNIINIYEFSYLCKEWAIKIDYKIESHIHLINKRIIGVASFNTQDNTTKFFQADAEPEAIFKACEWIRGQRK